MNQSKSYFVNDSQIADLSKRVVEHLYKNDKIVKYKHSGKVLTGGIGMLLSRPLSSIYCSIEGHPSLDTILRNAIHFSILTNTNATQEAEFKPIREATERKKNQLAFLERKKKKNEESGVDDELTAFEIEKTKMEIQVLEEKLSQIASAAGPQIVNSSILNLSKKVYEILLRRDRTSQNLYVEICRNLGITVNIYERFFDKSIEDQKYEKTKTEYREEYKPRPSIFRQEKGTYVPPALQSTRYGSRNESRYHSHDSRPYRHPTSDYSQRRSYRQSEAGTAEAGTTKAGAAESGAYVPHAMQNIVPKAEAFPELNQSVKEEPETKSIVKPQPKPKSNSIFSILDVDVDDNEIESQPISKAKSEKKHKSTPSVALGAWAKGSEALKASLKENWDEDDEPEEEQIEEKPRMVVLGKITRKA
jgi:hypothetical protein